MEKLYFTKNGFVAFLNKIKQDETIIEEMSARLGYLAEVGGDQYHDNFSYEQQVMELRMLANKINKDKKVLDNIQIIDNKKIDSSKVSIGTIVTLEINQQVSTWQILGHGESNPKQKKMAYNTPIGQVIIGKKAGDSVNCLLAGKNTVIKIIEIKHEDVRHENQE